MYTQELARTRIAPVLLAATLGSTMLAGCGEEFTPACHQVELGQAADPSDTIINDLKDRKEYQDRLDDMSGVHATAQKAYRLITRAGMKRSGPVGPHYGDEFYYCVSADGRVHYPILRNQYPLKLEKH